ncbi:MAG: NADPH-dependent glutamate synthase [bacterium]
MAKEINPKKTPIKQQDPKIRAKNFLEVALGYSEEEAVKEALRCINCKNKPCVSGCPVEIDIPSFITSVAKGDFRGAIAKIKEMNNLPAVCGRVCPQEDQCEKVCTLAKKWDPVGIGRLERFLADWEYGAGKGEAANKENIKVNPPSGKKAAVIGSGPAGLTCSGELAKLGHSVTVFEALHLPGGVLVYGIPEFRLPNEVILREVEYIKKLGVNFSFNQVIGKSLSIDEIKERNFKAFYISVGAGAPKFLNIPGETLNGVYSANEYLTRSNLMKAYLFPEYDTPVKRGKRVIVVGGGNVAMDSVRTALRLGAEEGIIVYRRSRVEMPARIEEIENAEAEGVKFNFLISPAEVLGDENGLVTGMKCLRMKLGEPDSSGRARPIPIPGSEFIIDADVVIIAVGTGANPLLLKTVPGLKLTKYGYIEADEITGQTSVPGVYAGGDIVTGSATVISAMGAGKRAAREIDKYLKTIS